MRGRGVVRREERKKGGRFEVRKQALILRWQGEQEGKKETVKGVR